VWKRLGALYVREGQYQPAADAYKEVVRIHPKDWETWAKIGECRWRLSETDAMIAAFEQVVSLKPDQSGAWSFIAQGLESKGETQKALETYERGVQQAPFDPQLWLNLAGLYKKLGRLADAKNAEDKATEVRLTIAKMRHSNVPNAVPEKVDHFIRGYVSSRNKPDISQEMSYFSPSVLYGDTRNITREELAMILRERRTKNPNTHYELNKIEDVVYKSVAKFIIVSASINCSDSRTKNGRRIELELWLSETDDDFRIALLREKPDAEKLGK